MSTGINVPETQPIGPVTEAQLDDAQGGGVWVYSGSDWTEVVDMAGHFYTFPPRGACIVRDIVDYPWAKDAAGRRIRVWEQKEITWPARKLAIAMCSEERWGKKGFTVLLGDAGDEERKRQARRKWIVFYEDYCRQQEAQWITRVTIFRSGNPGSMPPRQPRTVEHCQEWLEKLEKGHVDLGEASGGQLDAGVVCSYCSKPFMDREGFEEHLRARHPAAVGDPEAAVIPGRAEKEFRNKLSGKNGDPLAEETDGPTAYLVRKAKVLGVPIAPAELEGIILGDQIILDAVAHRIAEAAAGVEAPAKGAEERMNRVRARAQARKGK